MKLEGTVALVTGGAVRVGRAIGLELAHAGCDIAIHYHQSRLQAEDLASEIEKIGRRAVIISGDLEDASSWPTIVDRSVDALGRLDVLVNNASIFLTDTADTLEGFDPLLWTRMLRINLLAPMALSHHARTYLGASGLGKIINLGDGCVERPWPEHLAYCASKAGLAAMTKALARAFAPKVQVNAVAPGIAVFPDSYSPALREKLQRRVPLGRAGSPEEVAGLVRFLAESGDYITGQTIPIDGGRNLV
ncbi:MAG: SDR family oxidoreductase [Planctomycetes bacterium]|nr:SDR family oxidoreductase [Planctomycetota bacterium]